MSNVISTCFDKCPIPTTLFFMGLVIGGIPMLVSKVKNTKETKQVSSYVIMALTFALVMVLAFSDEIFGGTLGNANFDNLIQPYDIFNEPLYRIRIFKTENGVYLFTDFHHLIMDGVSLDIFLQLHPNQRL